MSILHRAEADVAETIPDPPAGDGWHRVCVWSLGQAEFVAERLLAALAAEGYPSENVRRLDRTLREAIGNTLVVVRPGMLSGVEVGYRVNAERTLVSVEGISSQPAREPLFELGVLLKDFDLKWLRYHRAGDGRLLLREYRVVH